MTLEALKTIVRTMLSGAFPCVTIQFDQIGDNPLHLGVSVYGVEPNAVRWLKDKILALDYDLCAGTDFALTPLVRDKETTAKFYPQFTSPWQAEAFGVSFASQLNMAFDVRLGWPSVLCPEQFEPAAWESSEAALMARVANQELALAA